MTPGDDNDAVWCLRMNPEGVNLVSNGTFDSATGWTEGGDWNIALGRATYTFDDDATGDLDQTIAAVSAAPYILEYEVTALAGSGFGLSLMGGGTAIVADAVVLPITLGVHRVNIFGVATKTLVRFYAHTFDGSDSISIDNVKVRKAEETTYIATQDLSLDNTYDGKVLAVNERISDVGWGADASGSGSISEVSSFQFTIARYSDNTKFDGFFNEFFPDEDGGVLIARDIEIGVVWNSASTDTEITWLMRGRVIDYRYEPRKLVITVLQSTEIDTRELPYYSVQKDFDNEVSYFTNAPDDNYGTALPLVYGSPNTYLDSQALFFPLLAPVVCVDKHKLKYICGTHKFETDNFNTGGGTASLFYKYLAGIDSYMTMTCENGGSSNTDIVAYVQNFDTLLSSDNIINGTINVMPSLPGSTNDIGDYSNLIDLDNTNEVTVTPEDDLSLAIDGSESDFGILSRDTGGVRIYFTQSDSNPADADADTKCMYYNPEYDSGTGGYGAGMAGLGWNTGDGDSVQYKEISSDFTSRDVNDEPWRPEELFNLQYVLQPYATYTNKYKLLWLRIGNIIVTDARKTRTMGGPGTRPWRQRRDFPNVHINPTTVQGFNYNITPIDNAFVQGEGREYGRWIDHISTTDASKNRTMGDVEGGLIDNPAYIIESLFRDEIFTERDLQVLSTADTTHFTCNDVASRVDDYYNYAEVYNATNSLKRYITDYVGSTNTFTITEDATPIAIGDNIYLTNIQGDLKIDYASFDVVGNTTNGTRKDWVFNRPIIEKLQAEEIIKELCFDSHCMLTESTNEDTGLPQIRLIALDTASSGDTWTKPVFVDRGGKLEGVRTSHTGLRDVFTSYRLFYHYDYGLQDYRKEILVDKNGYSNPSGGSTLTDEHQNLCKKAEQTNRVINPFSYSSNWIYDDATAELFLDKKINWFTKQRLKVDWISPLSNRTAGGTTDYIGYEIGDQVKLNYSQSIPAGLNNSSYFMITSKRIITVQGAPLIHWQLLEMG